MWYGKKTRTKMHGNLYDMLKGARSQGRKIVSWNLSPPSDIRLQHSSLVHTPWKCISKKNLSRAPSSSLGPQFQHSDWLSLPSILKILERASFHLIQFSSSVWSRGTVKFSKDWHPLTFRVTQGTNWTHCYGSGCLYKSSSHHLTTTAKAHIHALMLLIARVQDHSCCFTRATY